jgi:hypothetical protein
MSQVNFNNTGVSTEEGRAAKQGKLDALTPAERYWASASEMAETRSTSKQYFIEDDAREEQKTRVKAPAEAKPTYVESDDQPLLYTLTNPIGPSVQLARVGNTSIGIGFGPSILQIILFVVIGLGALISNI